jgi:putative acetyltransferase
MTVRGFNELDFPAVCSIYLEAKHDELQFESRNFEITPLEKDAVIMAAFKESAVLVFEEGEILGFSALYDNQLRAMFVRRDARGKGVGQALLEAARSWNKELVLNVAKSNAEAQRFYARNGFVVTGEASRIYHDTTITYIQMKSSLPVATMRPYPANSCRSIFSEQCGYQILLGGLKAVSKYAFLHAIVTVVFWLAPLTYTALGLGFKDKKTWTWLDKLVSETALPLANILTTPGRYFTWDGDGGFLIPALATSLCWGAFIAVVVNALKRLRRRQGQEI